MNINILKKAIEFEKSDGENLSTQCSNIYNFFEKMNETILNYVINNDLFNIQFLLLTGEIITIQFNEKLEFVNILSAFVNNDVIDEIDNTLLNIETFIQTLKQ